MERAEIIQRVDNIIHWCNDHDASDDAEALDKILYAFKQEEIALPIRNRETSLCVCRNSWSDEYPDEFCLYLKDDHDVIVQDIAIIREHKQNDSIEVLIYADENDEDYTNSFEINLYERQEDDN